MTAERVVTAASMARAQSSADKDPTLNLLAALSMANEWKAVRQLIDDWLNEDASLDAWPGRRSWVEMLGAATDVEITASLGDPKALEGALSKWAVARDATAA